MKTLKIYLIFILFLLIPVSYAQNYADITIEVFENGAITIEGTTNYPQLQNITSSQEFTTKKGKFWILNITTKENLDTFLFELILPEGSTTNYIKTTPTFRIENKDNKIHLIGTGENKPLTLIVQYQVKPQITTTAQNNLTNFLWLFLIVVILILAITAGIKFSKTNQKEINNKEETSESKIDLSILPQRQQDIINILKEKGKITQKQLENLMQIPKSSVSRNVKTLEIKHIIEKQQIGNTNYLSLKENN